MNGRNSSRAGPPPAALSISGRHSRQQAPTDGSAGAGAGAGTAADAELRINQPDGLATAGNVATRLQALEGMDYASLHGEWRRLYRAQPPKRLSRDLLVLGIAWKIQEQAYGGLGAATRRRLAELSSSLERDGDVTRGRVARLRPGAKLVREWRGESHTVIVVDDGFEWRGRRWRSLSVIAREITGGHWSGPRFFGLAENAGKQAHAKAKGASDA